MVLVLLSFSSGGCGSNSGQDDAGGDADTEADADFDAGPTPQLIIGHQPAVLTDLAHDALALVPEWLADDFAISLGKLEADDQDELALEILTADDAAWIDEIAFGIAHTSPEILSHELFYPELFTINAELIYIADAELDYVELTEHGEPGDSDHYTTTTYRYESAPGVVSEETIERDIYYWYVVHPRLEDELPLFVDGWTSGTAKSPDEGWFWRDFLWRSAADDCPPDRECPLLRDCFDNVEIVRDCTVDSDDVSEFEFNAIDQVWQEFIHNAIQWGAGSERPIQPNRIYSVGCGNCGEYADLLVSSARTALIPARNVGAHCNDHTWGEWWSVQWWGELNAYRNGVVRDRADNDCDGFADDLLDNEDQDEDGVGLSDGDCNDMDDAIYPGADEVQNGYDDDCDGIADPGFIDAQLDGDGDGSTIADGDCNDGDETIYPGAVEVSDGIDQDCDTVADNGADSVDVDADGFSISDGDCNDTVDSIYPGAPEEENRIDDDCDGLAEEGPDDTSDNDGDLYSVAMGDCNDTNGSIYPGQEELPNGIDDDCNGVADDGADLADSDADGYTILAGDCADNDATRYPGATEVSNGRDDNCDGVADEGLAGSDRDGDGLTMAEGDCNDLDRNSFPGAQDPRVSNNALYGIADARGDSYSSLERTRTYGTLNSYLEFEVTDMEGTPVDGAVIHIYGPYLVYGDEGLYAYVGETVTDLYGLARTVVGEYREIAYKVTSPLGDNPEGNYIRIGVDLTLPEETHFLEDWVPGEMPTPVTVSEEDLTGDEAAEVELSFTFEVEEHRIRGDGMYEGTFSLAGEGGWIDAFLVDDANYELFTADEPFTAQWLELRSSSSTASVNVPTAGGWHLVLANRDTLNATMVGDLGVSARAIADQGWDELPSLETRFRIGPGQHLAVELVPEPE